MKCDIGLIGLAVMGENLVLNMERNGFHVAVYNRTSSKTKEFIETRAEAKNITACYSLEDFAASLKRPRRIMIMVKAGAAVDTVIEALEPLVEAGDILIDGGNSYFKDSERRCAALAAKGIHFLGVGVSGGEEGALNGPSIMPGGSAEAYGQVRTIFEAIAARVDDQPCVAYMGARGAGHYVKMVHNGIEYGDMQLISEAYHLMRQALSMEAAEMAQVFESWNKGVLSSYLIEISAKVLKKMDDESGKPLVDVILDKAGQKGTGAWTSQESFAVGYPIPTINAAVEMRLLSALKGERTEAAGVYPSEGRSYTGSRQSFIDKLESALYVSKICSYAQGMALLQSASQAYDYELDTGAIALIWRGGCIIRAGFLDDVSRAYRQNAGLKNLLMAPYFQQEIKSRLPAWREVVCEAVTLGIPVMSMSASLAYFDSYRSRRLPANLIQAQRDLFGAHTYERIDRAGIFHSQWHD